MKKGRFVSLKVKFAILSIALVLFCTGAIGGYILFKLPTITVNSVGGDYLNILRSISRIIDADQLANLKSTDIEGEFYKKINSELESIRDSIGLEHLYLLKRINEKEFIVLQGNSGMVDATSSATAVKEEAGEEADAASGATSVDGVSKATEKVSEEVSYVTEVMKEGFLGKEGYELQDNEAWGKLFSVYLPLKNGQGETIGILCANFSGEAIYNEFTEVRSQILSIFLGVLLLGIVMAVLFSNYIVTTILQIKKHVERVEQGDLAVRITKHRNDEIGSLGESINSMSNTLAGIVGKIDTISGKLKSYSGELSYISENIAASSAETTASISEIVRGASLQAGELTLINNTLSGFNEMVQSIYVSLNTAKDHSELTENLTREGNSQLQNLIQSITGSMNSFDTVLEQVDVLSTDVQKIDEINEVILSISKNTNLLALNASIEASRAGESGRGFAIVAEEIRKLADQSKLSTDSIRQVVSEIMESVTSVVSASKDVKEKFTKQFEFIDNTDTAFQKITKSLEDAVPSLERAFKKADDMIKSKDEIIEKIGSVTEVSQETTACANEILIASEQISDTTQEIVDAAKTLDGLSQELWKETKVFHL